MILGMDLGVVHTVNYESPELTKDQTGIKGEC